MLWILLKHKLPSEEMKIRNNKNIVEKSLLFLWQTKTWVKKNSNNCFDVTMGSYDGAEICELVGLLHF